MKRLPVILLFLVGTLTWAPAALAQNVSPRVADPLILTAVDDTAFVFVDSTVAIDVLANDIETNSGCKKVLLDILEGPFNSVRSFPDGTYIDRGDVSTPDDDVIVYTPNAGFAGQDSLEYDVGRGGTGCGSTIDSAWVFIYVNRGPDARDDAFAVLPDATAELDVLDNDTDADGDSLRIDSLLTLPIHGMATFMDTTGARLPVIRYTPDDDFVGRDSLEYLAFDGKNGLDSAWVVLTVNTPPVAVADTAATLPGTPVDLDVLANDSDPDGGPLTIAAIPLGPANGTATINGAVITYTPRAGFNRADSLSYVAADALGGTDTTTVLIQVNTPPTALDDDADAFFEMPVDLDVLANDDDPDGDDLTVAAIVTPPANGSAALVGGGLRIRYTPDDDFFGADTLAYRVSDGRGGTDEATVAIAVLADAAVQFIHNALPAGPVDVYVDGARLLDDFDFRTATPYLNVPAGDATIDVTDGAAVDNSSPFFTTTLTLTPTEAYVAIANGLAGQNFDILVKENARPVAADTNSAEFFLAHGVLDAPASGLDVRLLDPATNNQPMQTLADDLNFEVLSDYQGLAPALYNIDVATFDGATRYNVYRFDLSAFEGRTFTLLLSGLLQPGTGDPAFALVGFDAQGQPLALATSTDEAVDLPEAFTLRGNFPNPFNPTTTIQFDLPEAAAVSVEVVDLLGRVVLVLPEQDVEAGANRTLGIDATRLASGTYFYRVLARTATDVTALTGQMTLIK